MRRIQTGLAAAAAIALATAFSAGGAAAQSFYVKGFGGATFPQDDDFKLNARGTGESLDTGLDYDTGYVLGVAGGYMFTPSIGVELEYAYRNADASFTNDGPNVSTASNAWMANALYYMTPMGPTGAWQPYVGGGLGVADLQVDDFPSDGGGDFDSDYNFAYQLIGGVAYNLTPQWRINGEVRFFGINDQDLENDVLSFKTPYHTLDLLIGATYSF
jgi:opacity protein-like surface antigen